MKFTVSTSLFFIFLLLLESHPEPQEKEFPPQDPEGEDDTVKSGTIQIHL